MNELFDSTSDFLAKRPGLLPLLGMLLILINLLLHLIFGLGNWFTNTNFLLHIGLIMAILGLLLIKPLQ